MPTRAVARLHGQLVPQQEHLPPSVLPSDIPLLCGYHVVTPCDGFFFFFGVQSWFGEASSALMWVPARRKDSRERQSRATVIFSI